MQDNSCVATAMNRRYLNHYHRKKKVSEIDQFLSRGSDLTGVCHGLISRGCCAWLVFQLLHFKCVCMFMGLKKGCYVAVFCDCLCGFAYSSDSFVLTASVLNNSWVRYGQYFFLFIEYLKEEIAHNSSLIWLVGCFSDTECCQVGNYP